MILDIVEQDLKYIQRSKIERKHGTLSTLQDNVQIWNGYLSQQKTGPDTRKMQMYELGSKQIPGLRIVNI